MNMWWMAAAALAFSCTAYGMVPGGTASTEHDPALAQTALSPVPVVRVDNSAVFLDEFQDRLNLVLHPDNRSNPLDLKKDLAASIIAEKILAAEAEHLHLETVPEAEMNIQQFEREAVYEKFMEDDIVSQVHFSEAELQAGYARFRQQRTVRYLEFTDSLVAVHAVRAIGKGIPFDSLVAPGRPAGTKTIEYAEALPSVEDAVYELRPGQTSRPINVDGIYYLFKLEKIAPHPKYSTGSFAYWRPAVEKRVKARKVARRLDDVVSQLLKTKSFEINRKVYDFVVDQITQRLPFKDEEKLQMPDLINREFAVLPPTLESQAAETFLRFADGSSWTIGDIWAKLRYGPYLLNYRSPVQFRAGFGALLRQMVIFETIVQRGYAKGLEQSAYVKKEKKLWRDDLLTRMYIRMVADSIHPTDQELQQQYETNNPAYMRPETRTVMEIIVGERSLAESLINRLRGGEDAKALALAYSLPLPAGKPGDPIVLARTNLREGEPAAFTLRPGGIYGPVALDSNRYMVMKLLSITPESPEPFSSVADRVRDDFVRTKTGQALERTLEVLVKKHAVVIDFEQLARAEVLEGSLLVRKSHFPNRYVVPFATRFNHRAAWCRGLFSGD